MNKKQSTKQLLQQAINIRKRIKTPSVQLQNYLFYQQSKVENRTLCFPCARLSKGELQVKNQFKRAFSTLSMHEKVVFYHMNVKNTQKILQNNDNKVLGLSLKISLNENNKNQEAPNLLLKAQVKDQMFFQRYTQSTIQIRPKQKILKIIGLQQPIDLHEYLIRNSKKQKKHQNIVLQSSSSLAKSSQTVRLSFNAVDFKDCYKTIYSVWEQAHYQNILKLLMFGDKEYKKQASQSLMNKNTLFLSQRQEYPRLLNKSFSKNLLNGQAVEDKKLSQINYNQIQKISNTRHKMMQQIKSFRNFFQQKQYLFYNEDGKRVRRIFHFQQKSLSIPSICKQIDDVNLIKIRKPYIKQIKFISSLRSERTNLYKEVDILNDQQVEFVYLRHEFSKDNAIYYFQKSINLQQFNSKNKNRQIKAKINYVTWKIQKIGSNKIQVTADANIEYEKKFKDIQKFTTLYIGQIKNSVQSQLDRVSQNIDRSSLSLKTNHFQNFYLSQIDDQNNSAEQFFTVLGSLNTNQQQVLEAHQQIYMNGNILIDNIEKIQRKKQLYLVHKFQMTPKQKGKPVFMVEQGSLVLWGDDWKVNNKGQLTYLNEQKIKVQTGVVKLVIKRLGKSLLSGSSVMSMSLPVQIFSKQSNIQRIARSYIYGPLFLQRAAKTSDPIQRIKNVFCFGLGFTVAYALVQKPFNPLLGQTYQGVIDGCPIYCQQVSHHPPICSTLFIGRGYKAYGSIEAKVNMGFNVISGVNQGFVFIQFENQSKIRFNNPSGDMYGLMFSERRLSFSKKTQFIDQNNRLFLQIQWGKQSNSRQDSKRNDFFCGKLLKIKEGVALNDHTKIKQKDIQTCFGEIHGRFTGKVYFENQFLFDVSSEAPYLITNYEPCLASDSRYRKDIIQRKKQNFQSSQQAKQQLEQIQRRDRRLRNKQ